MKKSVAVLFLSLALTGCVNPGKASVQPEQLQNHRFVLENVDGKAVTKTSAQPEIAFSALSDLSLVKNITVSGVMCNSFNGQGKLSEGALTVKTLAMTRKMLRKGAQVDLTEDQLTLATAEKTLMFKRAE